MKISKKIIMTIALFVALSTIGVSAATIEFTIGDTSFFSEKDGVVMQNSLEAAPFINESYRTMVPIRAVSDAFGAETSWNGDAQEVTVKNNDKEIKLVINSSTAYVNGEQTVLDCVPVIVNDRTFVPLRFIGEAFSYNVNYAKTTSQVIIDDTPIILKCGDYIVSLEEYKNLYNLYYNSSYDEAIKSGLSEADLVAYVNTAALETASFTLQVQNAFPNVGFDTADIEEIKNMIVSDSEFYNPPMNGLNTLVHEKYYLSLGNSVIKNVASTTIFDDLYKSEYTCAKHILVEDEKLAQEIYKKVTTGTNFDEAIKEFNTDPGMEQNPDGYVFTKGEMVEEFEAAAFSLEEGAISTPVKTSYGYHIIKREPLPPMSEELKYYMAADFANAKLEASLLPETLISEEELLDLLK